MDSARSTCKIGVLSRPDGSALFSEGDTAVLAGIYGPIEVKASKALVEKAVVETHFRPKAGLPGIKDRLNESIIKNICEAAIATALYPRASVVAIVQELQNSGQLISCAVNALCMAALDSSIDMKCMFAAVTCFLTGNEVLELIPNKDEDIKASFIFVFDNVARSVISTHTEGRFTADQYNDALSLCRDESVNTFEFFKKSLAIK